ncbi:MAG TPA: hypothetical protein VN922_23510, partial [Bacteroidia bacterium]|nr:hypothetical protein [Bacteroidia bacterium]
MIKKKPHRKNCNVVVLLSILFMMSINSSFAQNGTPASTPAATNPAAASAKSDSVRVAKKESGIIGSFKRIFHNPFKKNKQDTTSGKKSKPDSTAAKKGSKNADSAKAVKYATGLIHIPQVTTTNAKAPVGKTPSTPLAADTSKKYSKAKADSAAKSDSLAAKHKNSFVSKLEHTSTHGSISAGYDYGVLPFASDLQVPMGYFHSEGQGQFSIATLPFNGSFYYSDIKNISGLNNYFRVTFDVQKFSQQYLGKAAQQEEQIRNQLMQAYKSRQAAQQKLLYLESSIGQSVVKMPGTPQMPNANTGALGKAEGVVTNAVGDTIKKDEKGLKSDTINGPKGGNLIKSDSAALAKSLKSSLTKDTAGILKNDSSKTEIEKYKKEIEKYDKLIEKYNHQLNTLKNTASAMERNNPYINKVYNIMGGIKKFEIGLCYPNYSTFMLNGMAVKGLNIEYQKEGVFTSFTEGTTVNTLLFTNNSVQNRLINMQNYYNMFDFNSVQNGRKVIAGKIGLGEKEGTHFFIGLLYGTGLPSYVSTSTTTVPDGISKNYVLELDGQWALNKNNILSLVYGKSSTETYTSTYSTTDGGLFNSLKSKAALGKYKLMIPKTNSNITFT